MIRGLCALGGAASGIDVDEVFLRVALSLSLSLSLSSGNDVVRKKMGQ